MAEAGKVKFIHLHHLELVGMASVTTLQDTRVAHLESIKMLGVRVKGTPAPEDSMDLIMTEDDVIMARK